MITIQRAAHFFQLLAKSMPSETKRMMRRRWQREKVPYQGQKNKKQWSRPTGPLHCRKNKMKKAL